MIKIVKDQRLCLISIAEHPNMGAKSKDTNMTEVDRAEIKKPKFPLMDTKRGIPQTDVQKSLDALVAAAKSQEIKEILLKISRSEPEASYNSVLHVC